MPQGDSRVLLLLPLELSPPCRWHPRCVGQRVIVQRLSFTQSSSENAYLLWEGMWELPNGAQSEFYEKLCHFRVVTAHR